MPLNPSFTAEELSLANPSDITFTDDSGGSDGTITNRKIFIRAANGNWLDANGESSTIVSTDWTYADVSKTITLITASTATSVTVQWLAGSTIVYELTETACWNLYDYLFGLQILQGNTSSPSQVQDSNYYDNLIQFIVNIFNEEIAINPAEDIFSSQQAMNRNAVFINNENDSF